MEQLHLTNHKYNLRDHCFALNIQEQYSSILVQYGICDISIICFILIGKQINCTGHIDLSFVSVGTSWYHINYETILIC